MLETQTYIRKSFPVQVARVTADNLQDVANWCKGEVLAHNSTTPDDTRKNGDPYIKVGVRRPLHDRQTRAYVGDWVLSTNTGFKVYTTKAFMDNFEQESVETVLQETEPRVLENVEVFAVGLETNPLTDKTPVVELRTVATPADVAAGRLERGPIVVNDPV